MVQIITWQNTPQITDWLLSTDSPNSSKERSNKTSTLCLTDNTNWLLSDQISSAVLQPPDFKPFANI